MKTGEAFQTTELAQACAQIELRVTGCDRLDCRAERSALQEPTEQRKTCG